MAKHPAKSGGKSSVNSGGMPKMPKNPKGQPNR